MSHKAGFVNILGNPNVGKSTIMNALVGEKLSIITSKAQTTRQRIMGIVNGDDFQIVYSDTPGILKPRYKLQETMMNSVNLALSDADMIIYVTDVTEKGANEGEYIDKIKESEIPVLVVVNKVDLSNQDELEKIAGLWHASFPGSPVIPVSALKNFNLDVLLNAILSKLPEGEPYFPKDQLTDKIERFFASEIIREKILIHYKKEIPYSVEIEIESFSEEKSLIRIRAVIHVVRDSQKGIIIGHKGSMLKRVGTEARRDMEGFFRKKVFLEVYVKVSKDWRDKSDMLKKFGYR
ncbi:MAG: GTPase Era [Bacteroidetes bacterium GWF2_41_9]|nr:MAG: GTPase Era [Bacteroidetes bacterium GWA2_40_15]OFY00698.1 MAG: GTPase Era [Bacteroidetes bacterium GWC2_40_22]OFY59266.1 MAG: GTPase Era [Bacteroidetes bacterium GWF2_41_9]HAM10804.1 GTPase Era [Bacteroidales bacterium]HBH82626.1 GTPase Era [Bacteroidales bacterium]